MGSRSVAAFSTGVACFEHASRAYARVLPAHVFWISILILAESTHPLRADTTLALLIRAEQPIKYVLLLLSERIG